MLGVGECEGTQKMLLRELADEEKMDFLHFQSFKIRCKNEGVRKVTKQ